MAKITLTGAVRDEIYTSAINSMPHNGAAIAQVIATNPKNQPCTPKKAFEKACAFMQHNLQPDEQFNLLNAAAKNLLVNKYGYKPDLIDCYHLQIKNSGLILKGDNRLKSLLKSAPNMSRDLVKSVGQKISDMQKIKAGKEDVHMRLTKHQQWLCEREGILARASDLFGMDDQKLQEFSNSLPDHRANLSGLIIRDMDLSNYNLTGVICKEAKIENCVLGNISGADMSGSLIYNTKFVGSDMSYARLNNTRMDHVTVENYSSMSGVNFTDSEQHCVGFTNCNFKGAILSGQMASKYQNEFSNQQNNAPVSAPLSTDQQLENDKDQIQQQNDQNSYDEHSVMSM